VFRGTWLEVKDAVAAHPYDREKLAAVFLQTTREVGLLDLISAETQEDDLTTNATTVVLLGRVVEGARVRRAAFVLKNRGRQCLDEMTFFDITDSGLRLAG
jgi:hypothetical protein